MHYHGHAATVLDVGPYHSVLYPDEENVSEPGERLGLRLRSEAASRSLKAGTVFVVDMRYISPSPKDSEA